jgi:hypothetical protein
MQDEIVSIALHENGLLMVQSVIAMLLHPVDICTSQALAACSVL